VLQAYCNINNSISPRQNAILPCYSSVTNMSKRCYKWTQLQIIGYF